MGTIEGWPGHDVVVGTGHALHVRHAEPLHAGLPPAVAVHGLGGSSNNWTYLMRELRDTFDTWAPDLPGFGDSPPDYGRHTIGDYVADVTSYVDTFQRPVHLIANSMGGMVSVLLAAARPDLVATLSLISPAMPQYRLPPTARAMAVMAMPRLGESLMARANGVPAEEQVRRLSRLMYADPSALGADEIAFAIDERHRRMQQPYADAVLLEALRSIVGEYTKPPRRSAWAAAQRVLCPTLVLTGERDSLVGSWSRRRWRRTLPRSRVIHLDGSGHVAMMEHPSVVAGLIRTFVHDASRGRTTSGE